ncbi:MAG: GatB/YqeY domain-containing protein [Conchiformibius sp.]|nr:GatB/YqeY domain-containing protein [Conchiformibius sp.]
MNLKQRLNEDMKAAMRAKDQTALNTIRLANAQIKQFEVDNRTEADDARVTAILSKMIKQRKDSAAIYTQAGRNDLAAKEEAENDILRRYLPEMLSESDIRAEVAAAVAESGAAAPSDIGKVMPLLKSRLAGKADMGEVNRILKAFLAQ